MLPPPRPPSRPKTLWIVLGAVLFALLFCCGGCGLVGYLGLQRGRRDDGAAKAFADAALRTIGKDWSPATFRAYAAPTWRTTVPPETEKAVFTKYARTLGSLKTLGPLTSQGFFYGSRDGLPAGTRVNLLAPATFAKAKGQISLTAAKIDGRWGVESLRIDSPAFLK